MGKKIILFELNEVPYRIVDEFCSWRPNSSFARTLPVCRQYESYAEDRSALSPWKTWPSVHRGVNDEKHMIHDFGQDLSDVDVEYPPVWQILAKHGISTGVCGSLHTYPMPKNLEGYSFFLPDTFAAGSECFPKKLSAFQEFNLTMARESARNVEKSVPWAAALRFLAAAPELGLKLKTFADLGAQLVSERVQDWRTTRRRTWQSVLAFDVFMKQLETTTPSFSTFFTNHVASSMHRFWAAAFPQDYSEFGYDRRWVDTYRNEIDFTMSKFDEFFARLVAFVDRNPGYVLWVATSMGQAATQALPLETQLYVTDLARFTQAVGLGPDDWSRLPAMLPQVNLRVREQKVAEFRATIDTLEIAGNRLSYRETEKGFFSLDFGHPNLPADAPVSLRGIGVSCGKLGMANVEITDKSGTTAYHIPTGTLVVYDPADRSPKALGRPQISTLELAPTLLRNFGVPVPPYMKPPVSIGVVA